MNAPRLGDEADATGDRFGTPPRILAPLITGYFLAAAFSISLTEFAGTRASFWAATGILLVTLLRRPKREWPFIAAIIWLVDVFANIMFGSPLIIGIGIAAADVLEGLLAAALIVRVDRKIDAIEPRFLLYSFAAIVVATMCAATFGSTWLLMAGEVPFGDSWLVWFQADLLGTTTVAAALFFWTVPNFTRRRGARFWVELFLLTLLTASAAYLTFTNDLRLFILFPPLLLAALRGGIFGASASTLAMAVISLWFTLRGQGPIAATGLEPSAAIETVQTFIGVVFISSFPLAVVLELDRRLRDQLSRALDEADQARAAAEEAAGAKGDFLASMSHEIRTPLNSIIGFTDILLEDQSLDERQRRQISLVHNSGNALLAVVNDVLDFSKLEAGKINLHPEPFATEALIDASVSIMRASAEGKGLELTVSLDPQLGKYYVGDEHRLRQVLINLIGNAIKFTHSGRIAIHVAVKEAGSAADKIYFAIEDTGEGIAEDKQHRLFQSFSQADGSVTKRHGGTGLGLAISQRLIEAMGGTIGFTSEEGEGSTFCFELSLEKADGLAESPLEEVGLTTAVGAARILLVEDVPVNQELVCALLGKDGHEVDTADDGERAVEAARRGIYDLILMDIQMPKMDGMTATKIIRDLPGAAGTVPIIAMTANVLPEQVKAFFEAGMDDHVGKPIKQVELKAAINRALQAAPDPEAPEATAAYPVAFDRDTFDKVRTLLPPERLKTHLENFDRQLADICEVQASPQGLEGMAHKLVSQAGMLGFPYLSERCRELEQACRDGETDPAAFISVKLAAGEARQKLAELISGGQA